MTTALIVFYIVIAIALIVLVLLQDPKGGSGGIFGGSGGGGNTLFGATGATSFIVKATRWMAVLFAVLVVALNFTLVTGGSNSATETTNEIEAPKLTDEEPASDASPAPESALDSADESPQNNKGEEQ